MAMQKPLPIATDISRPFWDGLKQGKIQLPRCDDCQTWVFYPRRHCTHCFSHQLSWQEVSGQGTLYSYTLARIPTMPEFADEAPQAMAVVELDEGVRLNTTLVGLAEDEIEVGMTLAPVFAKVNAKGDTLLRFTAPNRETTRDETPSLEAGVDGKKQVPFDDGPALASLVTGKFGDWSNELTIDQELVNRFAELSGDDYWLHTDPERAKRESPYGTTIAHGALVQILQSRLKIPLDFELTGFSTMVNYGSDRLRFPAPVPVGSKVHARARVKDAEPTRKGTQVTLEVHTHVVGQERPSVINDLVILYR
ncbi:OB-fold domain-containing protein [Halomonas sp. PR-M31]|uniref:bifunctional OB-fold nucleic acid binding domain-containing protein/MaoC family dehydratase n=1 Tax=Halomonas sp. PR-M31 TaxID=1471202 RepID=UPI0006513705|nr:OB-fold domain-containing protein [Halomonas sp. PR-M31]